MAGVVTIKEPYWSAWKDYGWPEHTWSVGINENLYSSAGPVTIAVEWNKCTYRLTDEGKKLARKKSSGKAGAQQWIVPRFALELINGFEEEKIGKQAQIKFA